MIVVTVFLFIIKQTEFPWVHNQMENCHYDHIPINQKVIIKLFICINVGIYNAFIKQMMHIHIYGIYMNMHYLFNYLYTLFIYYLLFIYIYYYIYYYIIYIALKAYSHTGDERFSVSWGINWGPLKPLDLTSRQYCIKDLMRGPLLPLSCLTVN